MLYKLNYIFILELVLLSSLKSSLLLMSLCINPQSSKCPYVLPFNPILNLPICFTLQPSNCLCFHPPSSKCPHVFPQIMERIPESDPNCARTKEICKKALDVTQTELEYTTSSIYPPLYMSMGLMLSAIAYTYWSQISQWYEEIF